MAGDGSATSGRGGGMQRIEGCSLSIHPTVQPLPPSHVPSAFIPPRSLYHHPTRRLLPPRQLHPPTPPDSRSQRCMMGSGQAALPLTVSRSCTGGMRTGRAVLVAAPVSHSRPPSPRHSCKAFRHAGPAMRLAAPTAPPPGTQSPPTSPSAPPAQPPLALRSSCDRRARSAGGSTWWALP